MIKIKDLSIKVKLISGFLVISTLAVLITSQQSFKGGRKALEEASYKALIAIRETKKRQIESYFEQIRAQIINFSASPSTADAMFEFARAFKKVGIGPGNKKNKLENEKVEKWYREYFNDHMDYLKNYNLSIKQLTPSNSKSKILQKEYLVDNPHQVGNKYFLNRGKSKLKYNNVHEKYHAHFRSFTLKFGYYDLFLIDTKGNIVYTVNKEIDFGQNILSGPLANSNISKVYQETIKAANINFAKFIDFDFYIPSFFSPAAFIASPIFKNSKKVGILIFQIPLDKINEIMTGKNNWEREGLGKTGETYIVGKDKLLRNNSRFLITEPDRLFQQLKNLGTDDKTLKRMKDHNTSVLLQTVDTVASRKALSETSGTETVLDYRGIPVLSSYTYLKIIDVNWALLAEIDEEETFYPIYLLFRRNITIGSILCLIFGILGVFFANTIIKPLLRLRNVCRVIAKGDYKQQINLENKTEIGELANSFNFMVQKIRDKDSNMNSLLGGVKIGIFFFNSTGLISPQKSPSTFKIFPDFENVKDIYGFYEKYLNISREEMKSDLAHIWDPNQLMDFDSLRTLFLPNEVYIKGDDGDEKFINLSYTEELNEDKTRKLIIVIAEDVTKRVLAEKHGKFQAERVKRISKASEDLENFQIFLNSAREYLKKLEVVFHNSKELKVTDELKRDLHSCKGLFALFDYNKCAEYVNEMEDILTEKGSVDKIEFLKEKLNFVDEHFSEFNEDLESILGLSERGNFVRIQKDKYLRFKEFINGSDLGEVDKQVKELLKELSTYRFGIVMKKYQEYVESLNKKIDKKVNLILKENSSDVSYDEISRIDNSIGHIIRNCMDHGIEDAKERAKLGKKEGGSISISVERDQNDSITLIIQDDGQGINVDKLKLKAQEMGIWDKNETLQKSKNEILNLIFKSSFSTKETANEISGRGVGMDAVKSQIVKLGGEIVVSSEENLGTSFKIVLPKIS